MPHPDEEIIKAVCERMYKRRTREASSLRAQFTITYAVSVRTGRCYVGYNLEELKMTEVGSGGCSENRAAYVASTYDEELGDLVFFSLNDNSQLYNACERCQTWIYNARGFLKNQNQTWIIATFKPPTWEPVPLTNLEQDTLYDAGAEVISQESQDYFATVRF